jgi:adenine deaminase
MILKHHLVDLAGRRIFPAAIEIENGIIRSVRPCDEPVSGYLLPGFIDAHVHIESSMLVPSEFARIAVTHGTVATISDPHEIANVMGVEGVDYMIENGKRVPFHFFFGAPSCVPATAFETAGAVIGAAEIEKLMARPEILYLAEMMNYPGVIHHDPEVMAKIEAAKKQGKPVDGHAPGLRGEEMRKYFSAGISTDHECFTYEEGKEKAQSGVHILIREGSAARNFDALIPLLNEFPAQIMFCSDDKHPDSLLEGHINQLVKRALKAGCDLFDVLCAASLNVIRHYHLPVGYLQEGQSADFIIADNLEELNILATYVRGECVSENGTTQIPHLETPVINRFNCRLRDPADFRVKPGRGSMHVIEALEGQLVTNKLLLPVHEVNGLAESDPANDVLKIVVVNRYADAPPAIGFIRNFGLKKGAMASCVAHDCHNIVAVGTNDDDLAAAVNAIIANKGGISAACGHEHLSLPLPVAGILSPLPYDEVAHSYIAIDRFVKELGSPLRAPFMTLSFMALLVIPSLKLSDLGLFDGKDFRFISLFEEKMPVASS